MVRRMSLAISQIVNLGSWKYKEWIRNLRRLYDWSLAVQITNQMSSARIAETVNSNSTAKPSTKRNVRSKYSRPCDACAHRKVRCTDNRPCSRCIDYGISCTNTRIRKRSGPKPKIISELPFSNNISTSPKGTSQYLTIVTTVSGSKKGQDSLDEVESLSLIHI